MGSQLTPCLHSRILQEERSLPSRSRTCSKLSGEQEDAWVVQASLHRFVDDVESIRLALADRLALSYDDSKNSAADSRETPMSGPVRLVCPHCMHVGTTHQQIRDGATIRCSRCRQTFRSSKPDDVVPESEVVIKPDGLPPAHWYQDRTLQIGLTIPAVILGLFLGYLAWQHHQTLQKERVVALKSEAEEWARSGKIAEAARAYEDVISFVRNRMTQRPR